MFFSLVNLFFPKTCHGCGEVLSDNERQICTRCRHELPLTNYHYKAPDTIKRIFYGRLELEAATALFYFYKGGKVQKLLHNLKYKGHQDLGLFFGKWLGAELVESKLFSLIDVVIPVPVHPKKLKQRGYNQVALFAKQLALSLNATYEDKILIKSADTQTQVFQTREERFQSVFHSFAAVNIQKINNSHILLVDDLITTGATFEACALVLNKATNLRLSLASIAITHSIFR
jgi:ComF family protein